MQVTAARRHRRTGRSQRIGGEATLVENGDGTGSLTLGLRR
jgi:hypothetical protein